MSDVSTVGLKDLIPFATYRKGREEYIEKMIQYKQARRIRLTPFISVLFENKQTVLFQIQELIFSEDLTDEDEIMEYIDIFSAMLPSEAELSATLFIEIDDLPKLEETLVELKGIEGTLFLDVEDEPIQAVFEEEHDERDFTTSVHYIKFPLTPSAKAKLSGEKADVTVSLRLHHPNLKASVPLQQSTVRSLSTDLVK